MKYIITRMYPLVCCIWTTIMFAGSPLLQAPRAITEDEIAEKIKDLTMDMVFSAEDQSKNSRWCIAFSRMQDNQTNMKIQCVGRLPVELSADEACQFVRGIDAEYNVWEYQYKVFKDEMREVSVKAPAPIAQSMSMVAQPLITRDAITQNMNTSQCAEFLRNKQVVFYTGAGISAGVVPTLPQLMKSIGISADNMREQHGLIKKVLAQPESYVAIMISFYNACLYGMPTCAHRALKDILCVHNWGLLTENLDLLHQRSGIAPLSSLDGEEWLAKSISIEDLKQIDVVVTIGLASDERGFLQWYKNNNSSAIIIALNLALPDYLDSNDFFVQGDAQCIVPELLKKL